MSLDKKLEILSEGGFSAQNYKTGIKDVRKLIKDLERELKNHEKLFIRLGNLPTYWGSDLGHVYEDLKNLIVFLRTNSKLAVSATDLKAEFTSKGIKIR